MAAPPILALSALSAFVWAPPLSVHEIGGTFAPSLRSSPVAMQEFDLKNSTCAPLVRLDDCGEDTGGTCWLFACNPSRGPTDCLNHGCECRSGYCDVDGSCMASEALLLPARAGTPKRVTLTGEVCERGWRMHIGGQEHFCRDECCRHKSRATGLRTDDSYCRVRDASGRDVLRACAPQTRDAFWLQPAGAVLAALPSSPSELEDSLPGDTGEIDFKVQEDEDHGGNQQEVPQTMSRKGVLLAGFFGASSSVTLMLAAAAVRAQARSQLPENRRPLLMIA
mmetsp:Transcript_1166/g.2893  ORF Transcript_1166/g.2893 Transcript_1166/m.2893 type:complete len:280 (-) Transcript_1166:145-984(-)